MAGLGCGIVRFLTYSSLEDGKALLLDNAGTKQEQRQEAETEREKMIRLLV
jgi:hypothetical protein